MKPATVAVTAGRPPHQPDSPLNTPITMASVFVAGGDLEYGRYNNPTWSAFEEAWAGAIAWQFVRKYPDRLRALAACDTRAAADTEEGREGRLKMAQYVADWGSGRVAEIMGPKLFAPQTLATRHELVAAVRTVVERTTPAGIAAAQRGIAARPDATALLPSIRVPTLVLVGEHDAISPPAEMKAIADAIPRAQYVVIPRAGHMTTMENPEAVNAALTQFVERNI